MRFKLDENLPAEAARVLVTAGHDVSTVLQQQLGGKQDPRIAEICRSEARALITLDTDFGSIKTYPPEQYPGLIVLRLVHQDKPHVIRILVQMLDRFNRLQLAGRLWIVEEYRIRIRPGHD